MLRFCQFVCAIGLLVLCQEAVLAQNYCDANLCSRGEKHIGCNNQNRFQGCNGRVEDIRPLIQQILDLHNAGRDRVAGGQLSGFPTAVQMGAVAWDNELSRVAQFNVYQCRMQHDQCRNTQRFHYSGQNLAISWTSGSMSMPQFIKQSIDNWYNENRSANRGDVERFRGGSSRMIGHFTAMVHERNNRVGCAVATWRGSNGMNTYYLACNYAVTNMVDRAIYRFGNTGSQCRSGRDSKYRNLCSTNESYNYNQW